MSFDISTLITDRSASDVDRVRKLTAKIVSGTATKEELAEFNAASEKGAYNYADLNRVGIAVKYLADLLNGHGYNVSPFVKTDWEEDDYPTGADIISYLSGISAIRNAFAVMKSTPKAPPDMAGLTHTEANNIEKIWVDIDLLFKNSMSAWLYSGDVFSGEV